MAENPDRKECELIPVEGDLRFIETETPDGTRRILQRYEWSAHLKDHRWFDIHLATEDKPDG